MHHRSIGQHCRGACTCLALALLPLSHALGQIANGGFEAAGGSLQGWTTFNNVIPNVLTSTTTPRTGGHAARIFGGLNGNPNFSGMFQNVPAVGGEIWQASAYARHNSGETLSGTNRMVMKIEFYRVTGGTYGTGDLLSESELTVLDAGSPVNAWTPHTLQAVAPAQTVEARVAFVFVQNGNQPGTARIDDV